MQPDACAAERHPIIYIHARIRIPLRLCVYTSGGSSSSSIVVVVVIVVVIMVVIVVVIVV